MLDGKILAAVLATLAALAVTTSGGDLQDAGLSRQGGFLSGIDISSLLTSPVDTVKNYFFPDPKPVNSIRAEIEAGNLWEEKIKVKDAVLKPENLTSLELGSGMINSDTDIKLYGFSGKIFPSNVTEFKGRVEGVMASGANISENSRVSFRISTSRIILEGAKTDLLRFENSRAEFVSPTTTTDLRNVSTTVKISGFRGDISIMPLNRTVKLDGKVGTIEAGSFSFGK